MESIFLSELFPDGSRDTRDSLYLPQYSRDEYITCADAMGQK